MIVLLSCSINSLGTETDTIPSTGREDSILISYDDLRIVNSKLIELEYEKKTNKELKTICRSDSVIISSLRRGIDRITNDANNDIKKYKKQRNFISAFGLGTLVLLIISIL